MLDHFGDYMFELLYAPLKKGARAANQIYIFCKVVGRLFDGCKADLFRLREASMIVSADEALLPLHGQDRDMPRLKGESLDNYRIRLTMKGFIAQKAGTNEGIRYLARSFGYDNVQITPDPDPEKWAQATVLFIGGKIVLDDRALLLQELNKIKPARTLLSISKEQRYRAQTYLGTAYIIGKQLTLRQG